MAEEGAGEEEPEPEPESPQCAGSDQWLPKQPEESDLVDDVTFERELFSDKLSHSSGSSGLKSFNIGRVVVEVPLDQDTLNIVQTAYDAVKPCACGALIEFISSLPGCSAGNYVPSPKFTRKSPQEPKKARTESSQSPPASITVYGYWVKALRKGIRCLGRYQKDKSIIISSETPGFSDMEMAAHCNGLNPCQPKRDQSRHILIKADAWDNFASKFKIPDFD